MGTTATDVVVEEDKTVDGDGGSPAGPESPGHESSDGSGSPTGPEKPSKKGGLFSSIRDGLKKIANKIWNPIKEVLNKLAKKGEGIQLRRKAEKEKSKQSQQPPQPPQHQEQPIHPPQETQIPK